MHVQPLTVRRTGTLASVDCPVRAEAVPVEDCAKCRRGFVVAGAATQVLCTAAAVDAVAGDIMTREVVAVRPELSVERLILLLIDRGISAVPVLDHDRRPIGMASKTDLVFDRYEWAERRDEADCLRTVGPLPPGFHVVVDDEPESRTVRDVMAGDPVTVREHTPVVEVAALMAEHGVHGCPVVDGAGALVGMVTSLDVARWAAHR